MANEMGITQILRQLTLTLPADMVTVNLDVKMLKGQNTYSLNNNYTDLSFCARAQSISQCVDAGQLNVPT